MFVSRLKLENYRNFIDQTVELDPGINLIVGDNAQGKTNLMEALFFMSATRSHRTVKDRELIRLGAEAARLTVWLNRDGGETTLEARLSTRAKRQFFISGAREPLQRDFVGTLSAILFAPEDLDLLRDGASARRRFLDIALCQLHPKYMAYLLEYNRLHKHKTRILRDGADKPALWDVLPSFNQRMAEVGARIIATRAPFVRRLEAQAARIHHEMSGERLELRYKTVSTIEPAQFEGEIDTLISGLIAHQEKVAQGERAQGICLSGCHRDDMEIDIDGLPAKQFGSQGQVRTAALALKLGQRAVFQKELGYPPLLLLDDVLSELDPHRQEYILSHMDEGQALISCCDPIRLPRESRMLTVTAGTVK